MKSAEDLINYLDNLYSVAAQYDRPPRYPVNVVCNAIDEAPKGSDVLDRIAAGVSAYFQSKTCNDFEKFFPSETEDGWGWQVILCICITIVIKKSALLTTILVLLRNKG